MACSLNSKREMYAATIALVTGCLTGLNKLGSYVPAGRNDEKPNYTWVKVSHTLHR